MLTVKEMLYHYNGGKHTYCKCICECGSEAIKEATKLQSRQDQSCGCITAQKKSKSFRKSFIGQKFGRLTILEEDHSRRPTRAVCRCDCGNVVNIARADVVAGHTQSCGCLQRERAHNANIKDFTGATSSAGVKLIQPLFQNDKGVWMWECVCPLCGNSFAAMPAKIMSCHTTSCGCMIRSSRERMIESYLNEIHARFKKQVRFDDCRHIYTLPFDFAIYNDFDDLICLIEYDGEQHFRPVDLWGGKEGYEATKIRDAIKNEYCKNHSIKLIRVNYQNTEEEIKTQLKIFMNP